MLFGFAHTLGSLTRSPVASALHEARQMARRHLQAGGNVGSAADHLDDDFGGDFVLPPDIDPAEVASAIEAKLSGGRRSRAERGGSALAAFTAGPDGTVVVPAGAVQRPGDGALDRGKHVLDCIVSDIRATRALKRSWRATARPPTPGRTRHKNQVLLVLYRFLDQSALGDAHR